MISMSRMGSTLPATWSDLLAAGRLGEAADDLQDRVDLADVAEELVAQPLALARALDDARDVHQAQRRGDDLLRLDVLGDDSSRGSGMGTTPTLGSMVAKG
jgi:hypothetical protein